MPKDLANVVAEILHIVRTSPPHVYWHGLDQRRSLFAHVDEAIALLAPALADGDAQVRRYVARLIRDLDRRAAARVLAPLLADPDEDVRLEAAGAVLQQPGWYGRDPATKPPHLPEALRASLSAALQPLLSSWKLYVRERAIELLEMSGSFEHVPLLLARLPEPDWNRRSLIFRAIQRSADGFAILGSLVAHPDPETRASACVTLANVPQLISGSELARRIVTLLDDANESVRHGAAIAIGRRGLVEGEPKLIELVASVPDAERKRSIIHALGLLASENAVGVLLAELGPDNPVRSDAIDALGRMRPQPEIEDALIRISETDPDVYVRNHAVRALAEVGTSVAIPALERFFEKDARRMSKRLRKDALRTLPLAIEQLKKRPR